MFADFDGAWRQPLPRTLESPQPAPILLPRLISRGSQLNLEWYPSSRIFNLEALYSSVPDLADIEAQAFRVFDRRAN